MRVNSSCTIWPLTLESDEDQEEEGSIIQDGQTDAKFNKQVRATTESR